MLLKRAIHTLRFPIAIVLQILLPVGGIVVAMLFTLLIASSSGSDPSRTLTIPSSALQSSDLTLFYAQFDNSTDLNLSVSEILLSIYRLSSL